MADPYDDKSKQTVRELRRIAALIGLISVLLAVLPVGHSVTMRLVFAAVLSLTAVCVAWMSFHPAGSAPGLGSSPYRAGLLLMLPVGAALLALALILMR